MEERTKDKVIDMEVHEGEHEKEERHQRRNSNLREKRTFNNSFLCLSILQVVD